MYQTQQNDVKIQTPNPIQQVLLQNFYHDKNFGAALAVWDWVFGSLHHSVEFDTLELGIEKNQKDESHDLKYLYINPFVEIKNYFFKKFLKIKNKIYSINLKWRSLNEN